MLGFGAKGAAVWLALTSVVAGLGQERLISINATAGAFQIAGGPVSKGQVLVSDNEYWGVIRAAGDLALDFGRVTGINYTLSNGKPTSGPATYGYRPVNNKNNTFFTTTAPSNFTGPAYSEPSPSDVVIIAGTIGHSAVIDSLIASGKIDVSAVKGKWESFTSQVVENPVPGTAKALVIAGSDPRGSIFGIYDVSEQIGVSPWYFWADTPPKQSKNHYVILNKKVQGPPSVKYRGFFLNDEQPALTNWVATHYVDTPYGPGYGVEFHKLIFEVLLRLRANYFWPTLWASMFEVDDPGNQPLADAYEIVLGTSHTEPLMRAQNEFGKFYQGAWAYNLNNKTIDDYFRYGIQRAKPYARNSLWTVGMRGTGDTAIEGLGVEYIVEMLQTLVSNQRRLMSEGLEVKDVTTIPQAWCLYKEVMSYLFHGLEVPDDVTLLWADDNWGNVRRLPLKNETGRHGGAGVYYHFDYVGGTRSYKWINTVQLSKTAEQMHMAYARGADRIWVVNVGDMKALEVPINHYFDLAYDAKRWGVDSTAEWTRLWATREFAPAFAADISDVVQRYAMYASRRKFELVEPYVYSIINYNEAQAVEKQWADLVADAQAIYDKLPASLQPTFFQTVLHPALAGQIVHKINIGGARNFHFAQQRRNSANDVINAVVAAGQEDAELTARWDELLGGKWKHFMDQPHLGWDGYWQQPMRNSLPAMIHVQTNYPSVAGHVGIGVEGSNATIKGDDKYHGNSNNNLVTPPLDPYGPSTRYFEVFTRGTKECEWEAAPWQPWVKLSQYKGVVGAKGSDTRVFISIDWTKAPAAPYSGTININVTTPCKNLDRYGFRDPMVQVPVINRDVPSSFSKGFVESDGHVSISGTHYSAIIPASKSVPENKDVTYHKFANYGRTGSGIGLFPQNTEKLTVDTAPALEYDLYFFSNHSKANVTLYISPVLNYLGEHDPIEYGIALYPKGETPKPKSMKPVGPTVGGDMPANWDGMVADSIWGKWGETKTTFEVPKAGEYKLRIWALMPSIIVQKVIVDFGGVRPSWFGPPESFLAGRDAKGAYNVTSFLDEVDTVGGNRGEEGKLAQGGIKLEVKEDDKGHGGHGGGEGKGKGKGKGRH